MNSANPLGLRGWSVTLITKIVRDCHLLWHKEGERVSDHNHTDPGVDDVAVEQDGQFLAEGVDIQPRSNPNKGRMQPAAERSTLSGDDAGTVNAVQVSMDHSGAENIEAQRVTLDHSGAKSLSAQSAQLTNSGAVRLSAQKAELNASSIVLAQTKDLRLNQSRVVLAQSQSTSIEGAGRVGMLATGKVDATGDVNSTFMMAGAVKAGGDVNVTFNAVSAGVLGAAFAVTLFLLRRLFKR